MKILITGGAGFIGSNVAEAYLNAGHKVVIVDNLSTGKRENVPAKARFYQADICDASALEKIFDEEKVEIVNHLAAQADVRISVSNPGQDARVNIIGGLNLLELCQKRQVSKIIYSGTGGALYGETLQNSPTEDFSVDPFSHYGVSKYALELYIRLYAHLYKLNYTILRYANVYGPRQNPFGEAGVVAIYIHSMLENKSPLIFGDGKQLRDYVYVGDVAQANLKALDCPPDKTINIGSGVTTSVNTLFEILKKETGFKGQPQYEPKRAGEIQKSSLDASLAKKILGWKPTVSIKEGLQKTLAWQKGLNR
ncbi:MAG: NAD-dependent epimerase/dehydratase family protein [Deltaproteobacteria bacterium]|nr:NAD-dependent epimerase/dehydratase family protein [Deltaproteobacteria bacterium]